MTESGILERLQPHTVGIYDLASRNCNVRRVRARSLLTPERFDLFAKLYYIETRDSGQVELAREVYEKHILAFNPDRREPGREDKNSVRDFIDAFDSLIERFRIEDFDENISLVPVGENGCILDGSHRVAALAYYDKDVVIAEFQGVVPKCPFDYRYFLDRGLPWPVADTIAQVMVGWTENVFVACLWPRMGGERNKRKALAFLEEHHTVIYEKRISVTLDSLTRFISRIYESQSWVSNPLNVKAKATECFGCSREVHYVFFQSDRQDSVLADKIALRDTFRKGKSSLHISDTDEETLSVSKLILTADGLSLWYESSTTTSLRARLREGIYYFKKVRWINFKVFVSRVLKSIFQ